MAKAEVSAPPETPPTRPMTAEELLRLPTSMGERYDLVEGELRIMVPAGSRHGRVVSRINSRIEQLVERDHLGAAFGAETGFILSRNPDTVRAPDAAFVAAARLPAGELPEGFFPVAPDLSVEVISPSETATDVQRKVSQYFQAGTRLVWIVYPDMRQVVVFRSAREGVVLTADDMLDGGDLLPGFACRVAELFE
jgi:Uma2 family endonuclease